MIIVLGMTRRAKATWKRVGGITGVVAGVAGIITVMWNWNTWMEKLGIRGLGEY